MARPPKCRRVEFEPNITYFKPAGVPKCELEELTLNVDEIEAIRLKDLEGLEQEECAERMQVSRTTFQRILSNARCKVAEMIVKGKALRVEGGNYQVSLRHFQCDFCQHNFEVPFGQGCRQDIKCPKCGGFVHRI